MTHLDPVLVGVDGSPASSAAICFAAREAQRRGVGLRLAHVLPNYVPMAPMFAMFPSDLAEAGRGVLRAAAEEASALIAPDRVTSSLLNGPRVPALLVAAERASVVVIGSERRPTVDRLLTGSTMYGVASRAQCPVVAVPCEWTPGVEHHSVVAGVKSTEHSPELVRRALEIAAEHRARVLLVHAWELPSQYADIVHARVDLEEWSERARRAIDRSLSGLRDAYPDVPVETRVLHGQPARVLQRLSAEADLLLLARRHRAFPLGHLGGTARALLREGECPVEVVPPADEPTDLTDLVLEQAGARER